MKTALYPGSFDPITNGHLDIIKRALNIFDKLYIVISINPQKKTLFTLEERFDILKNVLKDYENIEIIQNDVLTVQKAKALKATHIVRGLRALTDFEYEFQLTHANRVLDQSIDTIFFMTENQHSFLSSSSVKEIAQFGGNIDSFLPDYVILKLKEKMKP
jgi:pantetheine-phosphate adenylyltransferase